MRRLALACCCCAAIIVGCRKSQNQASTDTTTTTTSPGTVAPAAAPATRSLGDVAGKWTVRVMTESGDSTILTYKLNTTSSGSGSTITLPNRPPMAVHIAASGDSIVSDAGPYSSVLRKGVQVTMHTASHLQGGKLVGTGAWHYKTSNPDSVLRFRIEGTRAP
jgi:hypothetical protein